MKVTLLKNSFLGKSQQSLLSHRVKESVLESSYIWTDSYEEAEILIFCEFLPNELPELLPYSFFIRSSWEELYNDPLKVISNEKRLFLREAKSFISPCSRKGSLKILAFLENSKDPIESFLTYSFLEKEAILRGWEIENYKGGESFLYSAKDLLSDFDCIISTEKKKNLFFLKGKKIYFTHNENILKNPSLEMDKVFNSFKKIDNFTFFKEDYKKSESQVKDNLLKPLLMGFSCTLPMIILGAFFIFSSHIISFFSFNNFLSNFFNYIGKEVVFFFTIPFLSAFIAFSIADRTAIFAGILGGFLANELGAGFIGGIVSGFLAGHLVKFLLKNLSLKGSLDYLSSFFIIPCLSSLIVSLLFFFIISPPVLFLISFLSKKISLFQEYNPFLFGFFLGAITAVDLGGIFTKASYAFGFSLLVTRDYAPLTAIVAGSMVPPLAMGIVVWIDLLLKEKKYNKFDRRAGNISFLLGIFSITEGSIPIAMKDLVRAIITSALGGGLAGGLVMLFPCFLKEGKGGILTFFSFSSFFEVIFFVACVIFGSLFTAIIFTFLNTKFLKKFFKIKKELSF